MTDIDPAAVLGELNAEAVIELVRRYEQRISKLEQRVFVLEKAMQDAQKLGIPYYGVPASACWSR
jgi:hypothetical protein